ncbi:hypothetical protein GS495_22845 [Rhodococcus hoagii]|nr:hypothetical protein [Prescottella equi]
MADSIGPIPPVACCTVVASHVATAARFEALEIPRAWVPVTTGPPLSPRSAQMSVSNPLSMTRSPTVMLRPTLVTTPQLKPVVLPALQTGAPTTGFAVPVMRSASALGTRTMLFASSDADVRLGRMIE